MPYSIFCRRFRLLYCIEEPFALLPWQLNTFAGLRTPPATSNKEPKRKDMFLQKRLFTSYQMTVWLHRVHGTIWIAKQCASFIWKRTVFNLQSSLIIAWHTHVSVKQLPMNDTARMCRIDGKNIIVHLCCSDMILHSEASKRDQVLAVKLVANG